MIKLIAILLIISSNLSILIDVIDSAIYKHNGQLLVKNYYERVFMPYYKSMNMETEGEPDTHEENKVPDFRVLTYPSIVGSASLPTINSSSWQSFNSGTTKL